MTLHQHSVLRRGIRIGASSLFVLTVALSTAACGSSEKSGDPFPSTSAASAASGASTDPSSAASDDPSSAGGGTSTAACVKDPDFPSGTSTVIWTISLKSKHKTSEATADHKFALKADGTLDPSTIEVGVDEVFTVTSTDDADKVTVVNIGCDDGQTVIRGVPNGYYITAPGTYAVTSGFDTRAAGTIVVK